MSEASVEVVLAEPSPQFKDAPVSTKSSKARRRRRTSRERLFALILGLLLGLVFLTGRPLWLNPVESIFQTHPATTQSAGAIVGFSGGCARFQVYAQNRWRPVGTAIRAAPSVLSTQVGSYPANMVIAMNGWVYGRPAYPTNVPPFNNSVWYHLADGAGWVSFAGVRAVPTAFDPTGLAAGGPPAAVSRRCAGAIQ